GTADIFATVAALRGRGVPFQTVPDTYYESVDARLPGHGEDLARLAQGRILVDGAPTEGGGLLLQIFTQTVIGPIFFEIIQRKGNEGFGEGNFQREMGKEGFFGPSTQFYHRHPPTGWTSWEGPLRPRAFDLAAINAVAASPWEADAILSNAHLRFRQWRTEGRMDRLVRNGDG